MADRPEISWEEVADKDFSLQSSAVASMFVTFFNMSCLGVIQVGAVMACLHRRMVWLHTLSLMYQGGFPLPPLQFSSS